VFRLPVGKPHHLAACPVGPLEAFAAGCGAKRFGKPLAFSESPSAEKGQDGFFRVMSSPQDAATGDSENPWRFRNRPQRKKAGMVFSA